MDNKQKYLNQKLTCLKMARDAIARSKALNAKARYATINPFQTRYTTDMPVLVTSVPCYDTSLRIGKSK